MSELMTVADMCRELKISKTTYYELAKRGEMPPTLSFGGNVRIRRVDYDRWLAARMAASVPLPPPPLPEVRS